MESNNPPRPGIKEPESFFAAPRLYADSIRSPISAHKPIMKKNGRRKKNPAEKMWGAME